MKKIFLLSLLSLLLSATLFGQVTFNAACPDDDLLVSIISLDWYTTSIPPAEAATTTIPSSVEALQEFHLVNINFSGGQDLAANADWQRIDLKLYQYGLGDTPIVVRYPVMIINASGATFRVFPRYAKGGLIGFDFSPIVTSNLGVASVAAVAAKTSPPSGSIIAPDNCIRMIRKNVSITYDDDFPCTLPNSISSWVTWTPSSSLGKETQAAGEITDISAYPNPVQHTLFVKKISSNNADLQQVEIFNLFGQKMTHKTNTRYGQDELQINTGQLESGIYMLEVTVSSGEKITRKVTVQH